MAIAAGTLLIIIGATLLGMRDSEANTPYQPIYLLLPVLAAFLGGFSSPMRKLGYSMVDSVPLAICVVQGAAFVALLLYLLATGKYRELIFRRETVLWFGLSGLLNSVAVSLNMTALEMGSVVLVSPLISTTPLFTVILSTVFLRSFERGNAQGAGGGGGHLPRRGRAHRLLRPIDRRTACARAGLKPSRHLAAPMLMHALVSPINTLFKQVRII